VGKTLWIILVDNHVDQGAEPVDEVGTNGGRSVDDVGTDFVRPQASTDSTGSMHSGGGRRYAV